MLCVQMRVADARKPPEEPHRRVTCHKCLQPCYRLIEADEQVFEFRDIKIECVRCFYEKAVGREMLDAVMSSMMN